MSLLRLCMKTPTVREAVSRGDSRLPTDLIERIRRSYGMRQCNDCSCWSRKRALRWCKDCNNRICKTCCLLGKRKVRCPRTGQVYTGPDRCKKCSTARPFFVTASAHPPFGSEDWQYTALGARWLQLNKCRECRKLAAWGYWSVGTKGVDFVELPWWCWLLWFVCECSWGFMC